MSEIVFPSTKAGNEVDRAVTAALQTIPGQVTQLDTRVTALENDVDDLQTLPAQLATIGLKLGDLAQLGTEEKTNLVDAINEVNDGVAEIPDLLNSKADKVTVGDFASSLASDYGDNITEVLEYLLEHGGGGGTTYSIVYSLGHSTSSSSKTQVLENKRYTTTLTPDSNYRIDSIAVTMGGTDITASSVTGFVIDIASVTGNIVITVVTKVINVFAEVNWLDTAYSIGDNLHSGYNYNAWSPGCARYDAEKGKVIFLQCHKPQHSSGNYMSSELWAINPYNLWDKELLATFPKESAANKVPLGFTIDEDGTYYVCSEYTRYKSLDRGDTWTSTPVVNRPTSLYGIQIIDGVMYCGDDGNPANTGAYRYWTSDDYGINWTQVDFGANIEAYSDTLEYLEANFCKFNGSIYAAIRRENASGLLCVLDSNNVWQVISDQMPSNCSDCYMTAIDDTICFAAVNRPDEILTLGRIVIDGTSVTVISDKTYQFNTGLDFDFHTPTFVYGPDFQMVTFMLGVTYVEYKTANNVAVVGYKDLSKNVMPTYDITEQPMSQSTFLASPYINANGTAPSIGKNNIVSNGHQIVNSTIRLCNTHPLQGTNVMAYVPNYEYSNSYNMWDGAEYNGKLYACYVANSSTKTVTTKIIAEAVAKSIYDYASKGLTLYNDGETTEFTYPLKIFSNLFYNSAAKYIAEIKPPVTSVD